MLSKIPFDELEKHHQQAKVCLQEALLDDDPELYRLAEELEEDVRLEMVRRMRYRTTPEVL